MTQAARAEGVSRSWTLRDANSPEVRHRIAEAIDARADRVGALIDQALDVIDNAMAAEQRQLDKDWTISLPSPRWLCPRLGVDA